MRHHPAPSTQLRRPHAADNVLPRDSACRKCGERTVAKPPLEPTARGIAQPVSVCASVGTYPSSGVSSPPHDKLV